MRHAQRVLAQLEHASEELNDLAHGAGGRVAIGTLLAAVGAPGSCRKRSRGSGRKRPRVIVDVVEGTNDRLQPMLLRGDLDMVVGRLSEFRHRAGLQQEPIYSEEILILARAGTPPSRGNRTSVSPTSRMPTGSCPRPKRPLRRQLEKAFFDAGLDPPRCVVQSISHLTNRHLICESDLIGAWPRGVAVGELAQGRLVSLPVPLNGAPWPVGVSTRKLVRLSPAAEALLSALRAAGGEPDED